MRTSTGNLSLESFFLVIKERSWSHKLCEIVNLEYSNLNLHVSTYIFWSLVK